MWKSDPKIVNNESFKFIDCLFYLTFHDATEENVNYVTRIKKDKLGLNKNKCTWFHPINTCKDAKRYRACVATTTKKYNSEFSRDFEELRRKRRLIPELEVYLSQHQENNESI